MVVPANTERVCLSCGAHAGLPGNFCSQCGAALPELCPYCGTANAPVSQFCAGCGHPPPKQEQAIGRVSGGSGPPVPILKAERRQLTVMFCDLSGSTRLSRELDPEELYGILGSYRNAAAEAVKQLDGTIAQYLGDGVLAFFGYPAANEDDAERAVRAGLEVVRQANALQTGLGRPLSVRVGIATGLVVVGEPDGMAQSGERSAVGEALNLAARLQALAPENGVIIAQNTARLLKGGFALRALSFPEARGFSQPIKAFAVLGLAAEGGDAEILSLSGKTEFVGREEEVSLLLRRWGQIAGGEGRVVLLQGDPGIGKSRIVDQLCTQLQNADHICLRFFGSRLHTQSALYPILRHIKRSAGLSDGDSEEERQAKITGLFSPFLKDGAGLDLRPIAHLMGVRQLADGFDELGAAQKRDKTLGALADYAARAAALKPLLVVFEDAHWMDPTSLDLLDRLVAQIGDHRILLIVCARPEYQPAWADHAPVTLCNLNRLGVREGAAMIASIAHGKALPASLTEQILNRGDGVPLFIEELTKAVLESGALAEQAQAYVLQGSLPALSLPGSLQASLVARLDRQPPAVKNLMQIGAVIGREFVHSVLESVADLPEADIADGLSKLTSSGLVHRRGKGPEAVYVFKHALVQDAAYSTLLKGRRQHLHGAIAKTLLEKFPAVATQQPEVLAHHLTVAGDIPRAIQFWLTAGRAQIRASADLEAIQHLQRGIELVTQLPDAAAARELEIVLQAALIGPLVAVEGPSSKRVAACCERGLQLATTGPGSPYVFPFTYGHFTHLVSTGQISKAVAVAQQFIEIAKRAGYEPGVVIGHRLLGMALLGLGKLQAARDALETSLALYDPERDENITYLFGQNAKVNSQALLSLALYLLGDEEHAKAIGFDCLQNANRLKHPHSMAIAMSYFGCWVLELCGDTAGMAVQAQRLVTLTDEYGLGILGVVGHFFVGWARFRNGESEAGIAAMDRAINTLNQAGFRLSVPNFIGLMAEAQRSTGRLEEARKTCDWAKAMMNECDERWFEPEILCIEAQIAFDAGAATREETEASLMKAVACAQSLPSPALEERCRRRQRALSSMQIA